MSTPVATDVKVFVPTRDLDESLGFYTALGWRMNWRSEALAEIEMGNVRLFLQKFYARKLAENFMIYVDVEDAERWYQHISSVLTNNSYAGARVAPPKRESHGALVTYAWDPCGVLIHFAQQDETQE